MNFVRLVHSHQWTEDKQHDHLCIPLEEAASEDYTLLLEISPNLSLGENVG